MATDWKAEQNKRIGWGRAAVRARDRASALQSARDAVVKAAKRRRIESHRYCDATKDADAKTVASPDTIAPLIKACQDLDAATDRLIALEEQT